MLKVVEFENASAYRENNLTEKYEVAAIINDTDMEQAVVKAVLMTRCKKYQTALRRFFKMLDGDTRFGEWKEIIEENCNSGVFSGHNGSCSWSVERCENTESDGGRVELTVISDKESKKAETTAEVTATGKAGKIPVMPLRMILPWRAAGEIPELLPKQVKVSKTLGNLDSAEESNHIRKVHSVNQTSRKNDPEVVNIIMIQILGVVRNAFRRPVWRKPTGNERYYQKSRAPPVLFNCLS